MSTLLDKPNARWWALAVLALTQLVVVLDTTIVAFALPDAQADLGMSDDQRQWIGLLVGGVALLAPFVWIETRVEQPLLPLRVVADSVRGGAFLIQAVAGSVMIGSMLYLTLQFQIVMGPSPLLAGVANVAMTVVIMGCTPLSTKILNLFGPRPLLIAGPLFAAAGLVFFAMAITPDGSYFTQVLPGLVLLGIGFSGLFVPLQNLALTGVAPHDAGVASATVNSTFHVGGSIGIAVFTVLYAGTVADSLESGADQLAAFTDGYSAAFMASGIGMLAAAAIAVFMNRGTKDQLMPQRSTKDAPVLVGAH